MIEPGVAVTRNAALRAALATAYPRIRFTVRNSTGRTPKVCWTDGPIPRAVATTLCGQPSWSQRDVFLQRTQTPALVAASYLAARAAGDDSYLREVSADPVTGRRGEPRWVLLAHTLDASDVGPDNWSLARAAVALAGLRPDQDALSAALALARVVFHHGHILDAVVTTSGPPNE